MNEHLSTFLIDDPETGEEERRAIQAHLQECAECRTSLASYRRALRLLNPQAQVPEAGRFVQRVLSRVDRAEGVDRTPRKRSWPVPLGLGAAVLSLFAIFYFTFQSFQTPRVATEDLLVSEDELMASVTEDL